MNGSLKVNEKKLETVFTLNQICLFSSVGVMVPFSEMVLMKDQVCLVLKKTVIVF